MNASPPASWRWVQYLTGLAIACGAVWGGASFSQNRPSASFPNWALGQTSATVTLVEYASLTCSHCREFHDTIYPTIKQRYVDTGRIRFVLRPMPTPPYDLAVGMHALTLCAGQSRYYPLIDAFYDRQGEVFAAASGETGPKGTIFAIAEDTGGLSYAASKACLRDPARQAQVRASADAGVAAGVSSTPTVFVNGVRVVMPAGQTHLELIDVTRALDAALNATASRPKLGAKAKKR